MASLGQKLGLLGGLLDGEVARVGPFMVTVDVTNRCNLRCLGCRSHSPNAPFPVEAATSSDVALALIERLCDSLARHKTSYLILSGEGEPMLNPRIFEIAAMGKRAGCEVTLFTNGTLLTPDSVASLCECGLDVLRVSLWAGSSEEYAKNYPGTPPGVFEKVAEGLRRVSDARKARGIRKPRLIVHEPLNRHNLRGLRDFLDLAARTGCDGVSFSPMRTWGEGHLDQFVIAQEDQSVLRKELHEARHWLEQRRMSHNIPEVLTRFTVGHDVWTATPCYIGWLHARIRMDGTVQACLTCEHKLGNLNDQALDEIWNGEYMRRLRRVLARRSDEPLPQDCDCTYCCYLGSNLRVHRIYRWLAPMTSLNWR